VTRNTAPPALDRRRARWARRGRRKRRPEESDSGTNEHAAISHDQSGEERAKRFHKKTGSV